MGTDEQKAILTHPAIKKEIDLEALLEYFTFQNFFTDKTLLKGIKLFPAGSYAFLPLSAMSQELRATRYWDYNFQEPAHPAPRQECIEELDRLFRQAVNRQLVSDVDVGAYLSGGMDSGSITAIADEIHQAYVPGRDASVTDVMLDAVGIIIVLSFAFRLFKTKTSLIH